MEYTQTQKVVLNHSLFVCTTMIQYKVYISSDASTKELLGPLRRVISLTSLRTFGGTDRRDLFTDFLASFIFAKYLQLILKLRFVYKQHQPQARGTGFLDVAEVQQTNHYLYFWMEKFITKLSNLTPIYLKYCYVIYHFFKVNLV